MRYVHYLPGGGLGDVFREAYFHNALGVLRRFKLEQPRSHLKLLLMSHNPATADFFVGQTWLDEVRVLPFLADDVGNWPACYRDHLSEFEGHTELRFNIPDHRSNYRSDLAIHRPRAKTVRQLTPVGMPWDLVLTAEDEALVARYAGRVIFHPYAGDFHRTLADDTREWLLGLSGAADWLVIGAQYDRVNHTDEDGVTLPPRVLVEVVRRARAVIGTESSVYYFASMLGVPALMLYRDGHAFSRWLHANDATWDWFFNMNDPCAEFVRMPLDDNGRARIQRWVETRAG